mgnify:CR=1 FL=1
MTLREYIKDSSPPRIAILILQDDGGIISIEYDKTEYEEINKELIDREVMETKEEDDLIEVWIRWENGGANINILQLE